MKEQDFFGAKTRDDWPWGGTSPPVVAFSYASGRGGQRFAAARHKAVRGGPSADSRNTEQIALLEGAEESARECFACVQARRVACYNLYFYR
jgi:hypothetical protein